MRKYLLLSLLIMGCYSGSGIYSVRNDKDPYNDTNILKQIDNGIMGFMNIDNANHYYFNIYYDVDKKLFYLNIDIDRDNWLFLEQIIFLADGEKITLPFSRDHRDVIGGGRVREWDVIQIEETTLKQLVNATKVTCRLVGSDYYHNLEDLSKIQERWKSFYNIELPKYR